MLDESLKLHDWISVWTILEDIEAEKAEKEMIDTPLIKTDILDGFSTKENKVEIYFDSIPLKVVLKDQQRLIETLRVIVILFGVNWILSNKMK